MSEIGARVVVSTGHYSTHISEVTTRMSAKAGERERVGALLLEGFRDVILTHAEHAPHEWVASALVGYLSMEIYLIDPKFRADAINHWSRIVGEEIAKRCAKNDTNQAKASG